MGKIQDIQSPNISETEWNRFIQSDKVVKIRSKILKDDLWIVSNPKHAWRVEDDAGIYFGKEIKLLHGSTQEELLTVHLLKKKFNGEVVDDEDLLTLNTQSIIETQLEKRQKDVKNRLADLVLKQTHKKKEKHHEQTSIKLFKNG